MDLIINHSTDPAFNLALEEYALTRMQREVIVLWRSRASVIIGRNQNAVEEIDTDYVRAHAIPVIRRQSGGGAVFHDLGNVNYTIIHALGEDDFSNYRRFTAPICGFLQTLGVDARLEGRNDLLIGSRKFSGNAQAVRNGRIMHHGTILFSADTAQLAGALRPPAAKIASKGVKSVRSRVTNVADHLPEPMGVEVFFDRLADYFRSNVEGLGEYALTPDDIAAVEALVAEKYGRWEWNIGRSPAYNYARSRRFAAGTVDLRLEVVNGVIRSAAIFGDFFGVQDKKVLEQRLCGVRHECADVHDALAGIDLQAFLHGISLEQLLTLF